MGGYIQYDKPANSLYHAVILTSGVMMNRVPAVPCWFIPSIGPPRERLEPYVVRFEPAAFSMV
jgi:hypothetical protein